MELSEKPLVAVVIVAAGRGERAGSKGGPKQYRPLQGSSMLWHTVEAFDRNQNVNHIQVVIHKDDSDQYAASGLNSPKLLNPANGGATRQISVCNGLDALEETAPDIVLIHDAARPFVSEVLIDEVIKSTKSANGTLPAVAIADTLKRGNEQGLVIDTVSRENLFAAQTPQGFNYDTILTAHRRAREKLRSDFTDDAALAEWAGISVKLVDGDVGNFKITSSDDMNRAEAAMSQNSNTLPDIRVGHGYDTHQWVPGTSVWLCGVELPHTHALSGHSDADVGLHALTDALLGAVADGDIGSHFPPSDPKWKGARSDQFLKHAVSRVQAAGGTITHMDVTLICESPKIGPHRDAMRAKISLISSIDISRISVKATTNERIGFIGREEGMVATATATVVMGM